MPLTKQQHLDPGYAPKRILSLDGGGLRSVLTLEYLEAIEVTLRKRCNNEKLLLCDYFDLIGGTSFGSIIATGLALGMSVGDLKALYRNIGSSVFVPGWSAKLGFGGLLAPKFPAKPLHDALDRMFGADTTLDSDKIRTGLMIMTKRLDAGGGPWPLHNSMRARYARQDGALRLTEILRASTAAPTYFEPQQIAISTRDGAVVNGVFVDGGVSPFNDPALQLLMLAALQGHGFQWKTGKDRNPSDLRRNGNHQGEPDHGRARRDADRRPEPARAAIADGRLRTGQSQHAPVADELPDALDHRSRGWRHEAR